MVGRVHRVGDHQGFPDMAHPGIPVPPQQGIAPTPSLHQTTAKSSALSASALTQGYTWGRSNCGKPVLAGGQLLGPTG